MSAVLVVRPSSLGDIVHALALVADVRRHMPALPIDWVAEEAFVPLVRLDPRIRTVIPVAFRRWKTHLLAPATLAEFADFRRTLRSVQYDAIVDLQEQIKGALIARMARGRRHGFDRQSIREPTATWLHDVHHRIERDQHFIDKARALAAAALGYAVTGAPRWEFATPAAGQIMPAQPYAMVFHATSRTDKLWPEPSWRELLAHFAQAGLTTLLPWGNAAEEARSHRLAVGALHAIVPPRQTIAELAALMNHAGIVVGVDTGLTHLAAAMGVPTVAVFTTTDASLAGVARAGAHARDLGGNGQVPSLDQVISAAGSMLRDTPRC
ncbi:MAG: lipopolysaccharide heptosyltransferase I [Burkholderiales bacterium]|nr:lipopolysaccharide heptosyltransferase I [Burkholderiales bacterium]